MECDAEEDPLVHVLVAVDDRKEADPVGETQVILPAELRDEKVLAELLADSTEKVSVADEVLPVMLLVALAESGMHT